MFYKTQSYLQFLWKSTNEHGVHSPFVFNYVTQCLYGKKQFSTQKTLNVLLKSIEYFKSKKIHVPNSDARKQVKSAFPETAFDFTIFDVFYVYQMDKASFKKILSEGRLHNDSMVLVDGIHETPEAWQAWKDLIEMPEITVSIDMFYCGTIFIRREQVKEHFTIRI
ncbi:MAG: hypothetical protein ABGX00_06535 [Allomuricauda sp.]